MSSAPMRECEICSQVDDHPRMVVLSPGGLVSAHHDCLAAAGNPEAAEIVKQAGGAQGAELRSLLQTGEITVQPAVADGPGEVTDAPAAPLDNSTPESGTA